MVIHCATPLLFALSLVESHMLSATQELENAHNAHQVNLTHHALKLRTLVTKSALLLHHQAVMLRLESATSVTTQLKPDVLILLLVRLHALSITTPLQSTSATGNMLSHNALLTRMLPRTRLSAPKPVKNQHSPNATTLPTLARSAITPRIKTVSTPLPIARLNNKKANVSRTN
jgi:hypothetical protein